MKKFLILIFIFTVFLIIFYISFFISQDKLERQLKSKWQVNINLEEFNIEDFYSDENGGLRRELLEVEKEGTIVKITNTKTDSPQKYIEDKKFLLESLFLPNTSPYPSIVTNLIECPEEFKPEIKLTTNGVIYKLFAGERFNYGICAQDLVIYYSIYGIFDCREKGIFEIRIFSKEQEVPETIIQSFDC